ncbi:hypothetical protein DXG03_001016 [Asterophora parasitica]|uniref:Uncharacterized protein n=1 Tax=Asterophora parasitica TaxID=117018 RepID=A0A9P7G762_9AGAR|nr:hypothetical protein DXG03_001016 [Asterophora parasitica]
MANRILRLQDPNLDVCPDPLEYNGIIMTGKMTTAEATQRLADAWTAASQARKAARVAQVAAAAAAVGQPGPRNPHAVDEGVYQPPSRLKKPYFDENKVADDYIIPRPSAYALLQLEAFGYVELWYFTKDGLQHAYTHNDINIVCDVDITWTQMTRGRFSLFQHLEKAGWPKKHVKALTNFLSMTNIPGSGGTGTTSSSRSRVQHCAHQRQAIGFNRAGVSHEGAGEGAR